MGKEYAMDGIEMCSGSDFHTWTGYVGVYKRKAKGHTAVTMITVPKALAEYLGFKHHDLVQVAIRKLEVDKAE